MRAEKSDRNTRLSTLKAEVERIDSQIREREKWLMNPTNYSRSTWRDVNQATLQLYYKLNELKDEIDSLFNHS